METALRYEGPRAFATDDPLLQRDLQALAASVDRLYRAQQDGNPLRLLFAKDVARSNVALSINTITPVSGTLECSLPAWQSGFVGLVCGVERRSASGAVTVRASAGGLLNDATTALTLPTALRIYLFIATPIGWKAVDDG